MEGEREGNSPSKPESLGRALSAVMTGGGGSMKRGTKGVEEDEEEEEAEDEEEGCTMGRM